MLFRFHSISSGQTEREGFLIRGINGSAIPFASDQERHLPATVVEQQGGYNDLAESILNHDNYSSFNLRTYADILKRNVFGQCKYHYQF